MVRRFVTVLSVLVVVVGVLLSGPAVGRSRMGAQAAAGAAARAVGHQSPADRREVAAGTRAYALGFEDGRFYANGWHITGEMGGVWTPPLKLVDGVWFGLDGQWVGPATTFTSGWGYTRYALPDTAGLKVARTDFVPDGAPGRAVRARASPTRARRGPRQLTVDAHSELMGQYPWGFDGVTPERQRQPARQRPLRRPAPHLHRRRARCPAAPAHHYAALVGTVADARPRARSATQFWGPQPATGAPAPSPARRPTRSPRVRRRPLRPRHRRTADATPSTCPAGGTRTVWLARGRLRPGPARPRRASSPGAADPARQLAAKMAARQALPRMTKLSLPGRPARAGRRRVGQAEPRRPHPDRRRTWRSAGPTRASSSRRRSGTVREATWIGAGYPDYPWIFGTDAEYTAFAAVVGRAVRGDQGAPARAARRLRPAQRPVGGGRPTRSIADGSIWFGQDSRTTNADGTTSYNFNTDETVKFPSTVALLWRWTGDDAVPRRDVRLRQAQPALRGAHPRRRRATAGPRGWAMSNAAGWARRSSTTRVYFIRGLYDLADMAQVQERRRDVRLGEQPRPQRCTQRSTRPGGMRCGVAVRRLARPSRATSSPSRSTGSGRLRWRLSCGSTGEAVPGLAPFAHGDAALAGREDPCYSGERAVQPRAVPHRLRRRRRAARARGPSSA